ncbi:unnamed protein product [Rhodiola kirilowii]
MERASVNNGTRTACAACKHQRKRCDEKCILAPFFPSDRTREFQAVHKVFGLSNLQKIVKSLNEEDKRRATDSLIWEAFCRQKDPVLGPYGEYRRLFDELKLYKSQLQMPLQVPNFGTNNGAPIDQFGTTNNPNYNIALLNYVQKNAGFGSNQYTSSSHQKSPKGQGEIGSIILPIQQHLLNSRYDQSNFKTGNFSPMDGEAAMESITWECGT